MTEEEIAKWAKKLIHRFDNVKIVGAGGEWSGDARQGFMFNPRPIITTAVTPGVTGACCFDDGTCSVITSDQCSSAGGTYQGDGTTCTPNPCPQPPTGACCVGTDCTIETEDDCTGMGGTYQGDGTDCDPNPCATVPCGGCFNPGFLGEHNYKFQTVTVLETIVDVSGSCGGRSGTNSFFQTTFFDPDNFCEQTCVDAGGSSDCSGSAFGNCCGDDGPDCSKSYDCDGWPATLPCTGSGLTCFGTLDSEGLGWCTPDSGFVTIDDATKVLNANCSGFCPGSTLTITVTLSGICSD